MQDTSDDPTTIGPEYQGWTNRETWAASLHLSNDQGLYEGAREVLAGTEVLGPWSHANGLEAYVMALVEENREITDDSSQSIGGNGVITMMDREVGSWWRVNWREVAEGLMED